MVPAQGRHAVAGSNAQVAQGDGQLLGAVCQVAVGVAVATLVGEPADDLLAAEVGLGASQDRRQGELKIHHQTVHDWLSGTGGMSRTATIGRSRSMAQVSHSWAV